VAVVTAWLSGVVRADFRGMPVELQAFLRSREADQDRGADLRGEGGKAADAHNVKPQPADPWMRMPGQSRSKHSRLSARAMR